MDPMAGRVPQAFIDELLARVDVVDLIDERLPLRQAGKEHKACCPFHDERTPSFTVSRAKQFYHCFGCGAHGTAITFLMDYEHLGFREAIEELAARVGLSMPSEATAATSGADETGALREALVRADDFFRQQLRQHPGAEQAIVALKRRGVSGEMAAKFGLGFAPDGWDNLLGALGGDARTRELLHRAGLLVKKDGGGYYDRFRERIMFPIQDQRGQVIGFGGRIVGDGEPKYLNSPETPLFHKGRELYGLHHARGPLRERAQAVVVEGYMDVLALVQHGIANTVATLGTATTATHLERLFRHAAEIVFCFDGDRAGREAAWRALDTALPYLHDGRQVSFLFLPEGQDPDSLVRAEGGPALRQRIDAATPLPDVLVERLEAQADLRRLDGRARLVELARPFVAKLPAGVLRELLVERLAERARSERGVVAEHLRAATGRRGGAAGAGRRTAAALPPLRSRLSPVAAAVSLLVQNPAFARLELGVGALAALEMAGVPLLLEVQRQLEATPALTTAALIERFRDSDHARHLEKLAVWDHFLIGDDLEREYGKTIELLHEMLIEQQHEALSRKAERNALDAQEKASFRALQDQLQKARASRLN